MKQLSKIVFFAIGIVTLLQASDQLEKQHEQEFSIHPVWYSMNAGISLTRKEKIDKYRTISNQMGATENAKIPKKTANICRIANYNVHFWRNPYGKWGAKDKDDFYRMVHVIRRINPDILILEEVGGGVQDMKAEFNKVFKKIGFAYIACCSTSENGVDAPGDLYNCILSKHPFAKPPIKKQYATNPNSSIKKQNPEQRCFIGASITLPNNTMISVYGTHLEVRPIIMRNEQANRALSPENARKAQLEELVDYIKSNDQNSNIIIGADFNTFRKQDLFYQIGNKTLWDILQGQWSDILKEMDVARNLRSFVDRQPPTFALDYLMEQGYQDSFAKAGVNSSQFTTWTGTRIDFLFLSPKWNLPVTGAYVWYDWASDHIPVIMDVSI